MLSAPGKVTQQTEKGTWVLGESSWATQQRGKAGLLSIVLLTILAQALHKGVPSHHVLARNRLKQELPISDEGMHQSTISQWQKRECLTLGNSSTNGAHLKQFKQVHTVR